MEEAFESCPSTLERPPWMGPLLDVACGATDLWDYTDGGRTHAGDEGSEQPRSTRDLGRGPGVCYNLT